jgi:hypothetical protein
LYELFNDSNIVNYIKAKRLAWAGHLTRMSNERTLKKIFNTKPEGTRSVGRPKLRWKDGVVQDTRTLSTAGRKWPLTEMNGQNSSRRPGSTKDCRANDDDDTGGILYST